MNLNRRKFMQLCAITAGGGVLGVGKAVGSPSTVSMGFRPFLPFTGKSFFTLKMEPYQWEIMKVICGPVYIVGRDGQRELCNIEET